MFQSHLGTVGTLEKYFWEQGIDCKVSIPPWDCWNFDNADGVYMMYYCDEFQSHLGTVGT